MKKSDLKTSCDKVVNFTYLQKLSNEELNEVKSELSETMIEKDQIDSEFDEVKSDYKGRVKPLKNKVISMLRLLKDKAKTVTEECYVMFEGEYAVYYNSDGEEVYKRPLEVSERQKTIFMDSRKAVNE